MNLFVDCAHWGPILKGKASVAHVLTLHTELGLVSLCWSCAAVVLHSTQSYDRSSHNVTLFMYCRRLSKNYLPKRKDEETP